MGSLPELYFTMTTKTSLKDLEETIKEKVAPLLEEVMEKNLGVHIPQMEQDLSDKLSNPLANIYIPVNLSFRKAKQRFKKEFFQKELILHLGNISHLAKTLGLDRRSIHRTIKELDIRIKPLVESSIYQEQLVQETVKGILDNYWKIIRPEKMEKLYQEAPSLSRNIAKLLPHPELTWKEIEQEFEKQFLAQVLKQNGWSISTTSKKIKLRVETLHRKIKKLELKKK